MSTESSPSSLTSGPRISTEWSLAGQAAVVLENRHLRAVLLPGLGGKIISLVDKAADTELLLADDVSSALDAATEIELWESLRERGATVIGATSKAAALARADQVVVLAEGRVVDAGPWTELASRWSHLAG